MLVMVVVVVVVVGDTVPSDLDSTVDGSEE